MTPRTLSRSIALALALLTLPLMACGTEETAATPAPEPIAMGMMPLVADCQPTVTGGTFANHVFRNGQSYQSCNNPDPPHCVTFTAALPPAREGMDLRVLPIVPIISITGQPAYFEPEGAPPCYEPMLAELVYSTDAWVWPRSLPADRIATMERAATRLTVSLCFRGEVRAQLGDLTGTISYVRIQPLHR